MIPQALTTLTLCLLALVNADLEQCKDNIIMANLAPCSEVEIDDGKNCRTLQVGTYGRGAGRLPYVKPCPDGLRDDGISCWSDAHIYGKGCCCTIWGCCGNCPTGYHDDGCTCRKIDVGIKLTLFDRQYCRADEDLYLALCYPKCKEGYNALECCLCVPNAEGAITTPYSERLYCPETDQILFEEYCISLSACALREAVTALDSENVTLDALEEVWYES